MCGRVIDQIASPVDSNTRGPELFPGRPSKPEDERGREPAAKTEAGGLSSMARSDLASRFYPPLPPLPGCLGDRGKLMFPTT